EHAAGVAGGGHELATRATTSTTGASSTVERRERRRGTPMHRSGLCGPWLYFRIFRPCGGAGGVQRRRGQRRRGGAPAGQSVAW
ncbi:MAG TPA: hypothetical protein VKU91_04185, partial [Acidimicrobiales bacterium]|nr:hypothetical protein [Acidimicrobiales bacterium]